MDVTWLKLDDGWQSHPKMQRIGPLGRELWLAGALYAARHLTDGLIDKSALAMLAGTAGVKPALVSTLVDTGLWHDSGEHYEIHDYLDYNPSHAEVEKGREEGKERQRKARESRVSHAVTDTVTNAVTSRDPSPTRPLSVKTSTTTSTSYRREVVVVLNAILEAELADENPSSIRRPDAWRAKVRPRIEAEWGPVFADAMRTLRTSEDVTIYDIASQVLDEHEHKLHYQILSRIADLEITCTPPKPNESALDSKPSGPADDGPNRPSASGAGDSSETSSTPQNEPSSASVTDIASSRRSRSGGRPTEPSPAASSTPKPAQNGKDRPTVDEQSSPTSEPTSSVEHALSVAASLGARLAKAGKPRHEVLELMSGFPDAEVAAAVDAWVAAMPERRRYENVVYQVDHVRPEDGQVFTVKVHQGGHVTGFRADFPADVWRSAELVEA